MVGNSERDETANMSRRFIKKSFDIEASFGELEKLAKTAERFDRKQRAELHALVVGVQRATLAVFRTSAMKSVVDRRLDAAGRKVTVGGGYSMAIMRLYVNDRHKAARLARAVRGAIVTDVGPDRLLKRLKKKTTTLSQLEAEYRRVVRGEKKNSAPVIKVPNSSTGSRTGDEDLIVQDRGDCQFRTFGVASRARSDIRFRKGRALAVIDVESRNRVSIRHIAFDEGEGRKLFARWAN